MKKLHAGIISYSPTDLNRFFESEFASWMDHYYETSLDSGLLSNVHKNPPDPLQSILAEKGNIHEEEVLQKILEHSTVARIERTDETKTADLIQATKGAITVGEPYIYQAALPGPSFFGYADLLRRVDGDSKLGSYHYEPLDMKIALSPKPTAILQLCAYAENLEHIQGRLPDQISVVTRGGEIHTYQTGQFFAFYTVFKKRFERFHKEYAPENQPLPSKGDEHREWSIYAKKTLHERDDVQLTARIRQTCVEVLRINGIQTLTELSRINPSDRIGGLSEDVLSVLQRQADLQVRSPRDGKPLFELLEHPEGIRVGLSMLPDSDPMDVFFDMEGYPLLGKNGLEYLYGSVERGDGKTKYIEFWAKTLTDEERAFREFMEFAFKRWTENPGMHIYHYGHYEPSTLKRLMGSHGVCERIMEELLRNEVFVDLYQVVIHGLRVGTHSYGLKSIERLYYSERSTTVGSGAESAVEFSNYLETGDGRFLDRIRDYNQDDCYSTKDLELFLRKIKDEKEITYVPLQSEGIEERTPDPDAIKEQCSRKAEEMLDALPDEKLGLPLEDADPADYVQELIAHMLDFHRREENPDWSDYFQRRDLSPDQMFNEVSVLFGVQIVGSYDAGLICKFDPSQDTKFRNGVEVLILENEAPFEKLTVEDWDILRGTFNLTGTPVKVPEGRFSLAPAKSNIRKDALLRSLLGVAENFSRESETFGLRPAVFDLLLKRPPRVAGCKVGEPLISCDRELVGQIGTIVAGMKGGCLCIQGPPGAGKTYTASKVIASLLKEGKSVAISSNSHKAIGNLLKRVDKECREDRGYCRPVKLTSRNRIEEELEDFTESAVPVKVSSTSLNVLFGNSRKPLHANGPVNIVGATAYYLCRDDHIDRFDYLFVDEATQVCLANLVGMARCAENIVLMGDQMQLEQPTQASHPGDSGNSALVHLTNGESVIDPSSGIFLPITYRMHPNVNGLISELFYEGALRTDPPNENQSVLWTHKAKGSYPGHGINFIPVDHVGNTHGSEEEADIIKCIFESALQSKWRDKDRSEHPITLSDILIVAPYNYQVSLIKEKLDNPEARVGSVDLFQGQEAPIVILSLCASTTRDAPRGISFLLNRNRINVALSRAKCLALVVGCPQLATGKVSTIPGMELLNVICRISSYTT